MSVEKVIEVLGITREQCEVYAEEFDEETLKYTISWKGYEIHVIDDYIMFECPCDDCKGHETNISDKDFEKIMGLIRPPRD
jgi:hypothetical protein